MIASVPSRRHPLGFGGAGDDEELLNLVLYDAITEYNACIDCMPSLTIRNIDSKLKARLRVRAARHDRSMEEEVRAILREAVVEEGESATNLAAAIAECFSAVGGVELKIPPREAMREPPKPR